MAGWALRQCAFLFRGLGIGELGLFLGQQLQDGLPARLVGFLGQQAPVMLDVQMSHRPVHGAFGAPHETQ